MTASLARSRHSPSARRAASRRARRGGRWRLAALAVLAFAVWRTPLPDALLERAEPELAGRGSRRAAPRRGAHGAGGAFLAGAARSDLALGRARVAGGRGRAVLRASGGRPAGHGARFRAARARASRRLGSEHAHPAARAQRRAASADRLRQARRNRGRSSHRALARQAADPRGVPRAHRVRSEPSRNRRREPLLLRQAGARARPRRGGRARVDSARPNPLRSQARPGAARAAAAARARAHERARARRRSMPSSSRERRRFASCAASDRSAPSIWSPPSRAAASSHRCVACPRRRHASKRRSTRVFSARPKPRPRGPSERLRDYGASAASVVVLDNATGDVLAYVGSPDFHDAKALGQNDGVRALRQPGSTLKPFVYAAAMRELGLTAASLLPDVELSLPSERGVFSPKNYDRRAHGPVLVREALASSLNVPAVVVANRLGVERALAALHEAGFESLVASTRRLRRRSRARRRRGEASRARSRVRDARARWHARARARACARSSTLRARGTTFRRRAPSAFSTRASPPSSRTCSRIRPLAPRRSGAATFSSFPFPSR